MVDVAGMAEAAAAVDFGASNTDVAVVVDRELHVWTQPSGYLPTVEGLRAILSASSIAWHNYQAIALTGGHHRGLPDVLDDVPLVKVGELDAIARGGQALATGTLMRPEQAMLVVSAGSGTAMVAAHGHAYQHITGTGMGGGTLLGLGRLLLNCVDPVALDALALIGNPNGVDLALRDVVTGPIGALPADATAVNFGRMARTIERASDADMAAGIVNMVGQVVATLAINAARAARVERVVVTGHLTDMRSVRATMRRVGDFFGLPLDLYEQAGYATVVGALLYAVER